MTKTKNQYDLLVVGAGLYGAVVARLARDRGLKVLVLERRKNIGGNCRDAWTDGICVHQYGAHIFHTDDEDVWRFSNRYASFNNYIHEVITRVGNRLVRLPLNLGTFYDIFGCSEPWQIEDILASEQEKEYYDSPKNMEEQAVNLIGRTLYEKIIKGYTEKQWGRPATTLPTSLIQRLPIRRTFDNRYFNDRYQGIPEKGYTRMIEKMLDGVEVRTGVAFCKERSYCLQQAQRVVYTGMVDELLDYRYGPLPYRSLWFEHKYLDRSIYQGAAVINEASRDIPYTRTIEYKHFFYDTKTPYTIVTHEYPQGWQPGREAFYPIQNDESQRLYQRYIKLLENVYPKIELGGRLGLYRYFDMDDAIKQALSWFTHFSRSLVK